MLLCLLGPAVAPLCAQVYSASITGAVADPSGAVIPGAKVVARDVAKGLTYSTVSNMTGLYTVGNLPPSTYDLTITAVGFEIASRAGITLEVNQHATVNVQMKLGTTAQSETVTAAPPILEAQDATTGQTVDRALIDDLPLIGRTVFDLAFLSPGINPPAGQALGYGQQANDFDSNGGRPATAGLMIDGVSVTAAGAATMAVSPLYTPSVDAVQEFKVEQNNFSADKGFGGNTVINVVMRSGTNRFHGNVYEFLRNKSLDANDWFSNRAGIPLPGLRRNDFGFTFGGPIRKNRTFFFSDYEGARTSSAATFSAGVPSAGERKGDFGELCADNGGTFDSAGICSKPAGQLWDPYSAVYNAQIGQAPRTVRIPFNNLATYMSPGSSVLAGTPYQPAAAPGNLIDPVAAKVMSYFPLPNLNAGTSAYNRFNNYAAAGSNASSNDQLDIKVDHLISDYTRFSARYSMNNNQTSPANPWNNPLFGGSNGPATTGTVSANLQASHSFSPTFLLNASYGYTRSAQDRSGLDASFPNFNAISTLGLPSYMSTSGVDIAPLIQISSGYIVSNGASIGSNGGAINHEHLEVHDLLVSLSKTRRRHEFQFGGEMRMTRNYNIQRVSPGGSFTFVSSTTAQINSPTAGGDAMASFLTGFPSNGSYEIRPAIATQSFDYAGYFQDNWHATNRLTLNLGLRYELQLPRTERYDRMEWLDPAAISPLSGQVSLSPIAAAVFSAAGLTAPDLGTLHGGMEFASGQQRYPVAPNFMGGFQPRFGFAYRLPHDTVLRGGYGIYDAVTDYTAAGVGAGGIDGFLANTTLLTTYQGNGYTPYGRLSDPFSDGLLLPAGRSQGLSTELGTSPTGMIRNWNQVPNVQTWSLGVQRQFGSTLVDAEYVGSKGTHLYYSDAAPMNFLGPWVEHATSAQLTALNTNVPNPFYGHITTTGCTICGPNVRASQLAVPFPEFKGFGGPVTAPWANSSYNALQLKVEKRFSHGLEVLANYTWSKTLDDSSSGNIHNLNFLGGVTAPLQDPNDLRLERSVSQYDIPQVITFSYVWQLPFGRGQHWGSNWGGIAGKFIGGWQTQGFWRFDDGQPLEILLAGGLSTPFPTYGNLRPNLTGTLRKNNCNETCMVQQYFADPQVAVAPPIFSLGTAPRMVDSVRSQGNQNANLSLFKNFSVRKLGESGLLQFRIETFNAFNHVQFGRPNMTVGGGTFGLITRQANSPRQVQIAAKLYW